MSSTGSSEERRTLSSTVRAPRYWKGTGRPRYTFSTEQKQLLEQSFKEIPYPNYARRVELARQLQCKLFVIEKWFQNKRARLTPGERKRLRSTRTQLTFPSPRSLLFSVQNMQTLPPSATTQPPPQAQAAVLGGAGYSSVDTQQASWHQGGSRDSLVPGLRMSPSYGFQGQGIGHTSFNSGPPFFIPPAPSLQWSNKGSQGQQLNVWGFPALQLQGYQENPLFQDESETEPDLSELW